MATEIRTQIPGNVWKVLIAEGDQVTVGQLLFIMEVMKTEVSHDSTVAGTVKTVLIVEGQEGLDADEVAIVIEED